MKVVIQKVKAASVLVDEVLLGQIGEGLLLLLGIEDSDQEEDMDWLCRKIVNMRIFNDSEGVMNHSVLDVDGEILLVSQFTLHASTKKGNRPSYIQAAKPEKAEKFYEEMKIKLRQSLGKEVQSGEFGANMLVELKNDGPVTIIIDSKNRA